MLFPVQRGKLDPLPLRYCGSVRKAHPLAGGREDGKWDVLGLNFPTSDITTSGHVCGVIYTFFLFCPSKRRGWHPGRGHPGLLFDTALAMIKLNN